MAMMGSATAGGADRARIAAEQAVASPLLEDVNLAGARGVLVNITASSGLKMKEYHEVMNTIKEFTADDAMVIVGTVIDEAMDDELRVTMIATGLGGAAAAQRGSRRARGRRARWSSAPGPTASACRSRPIDYETLDQRRRSSGAGARRRRRRGASAFDASDIPAFLRKQAD